MERTATATRCRHVLYVTRTIVYARALQGSSPFRLTMWQVKGLEITITVVSRISYYGTSGKKGLLTLGLSRLACVTRGRSSSPGSRACGTLRSFEKFHLLPTNHGHGTVKVRRVPVDTFKLSDHCASDSQRSSPLPAWPRTDSSVCSGLQIMQGVYIGVGR